jgi:hypothetical protein
MQKAKKKLAVGRETIRRLDDLALRGIVGRGTNRTCSDLCGDTDVGCIDTAFIHGCVPATNKYC